MSIRGKTKKHKTTTTTTTKTKSQHKSHCIEAYTNHWTNLRRREAKRKKEFKLEAWERGPQTQYFLKKNEKSEQYYTNEGTN